MIGGDLCACPEFPPAVIDAGKGMSAESRRAWFEEKGLILKQTYWYTPKHSLYVSIKQKS